MTLKQALRQARTILDSARIEDAALEAELLLRHALKTDRVQLYLDLDREPVPEQEKTFLRLVERRLKGEPTAYITGHREFCGLDFRVDPAVLIPRPETEMLVERAIELSRDRKISRIADIGTGCGAIAISLALRLPAVKIYATDVSGPALEVARLNCRLHGVEDRICLLHGDLLEPLPAPVDLIIANMPYVRESELPQTGPGSFEPVSALDGGPDGLVIIRRLCMQAGGKLRPQGTLLLEIGLGQAGPLVTFLARLFPLARIEVFPDLSDIERVVSVNLTADDLTAKLEWIFPTGTTTKEKEELAQ